MKNRLKTYIATQSNLAEEEVVFGLYGVINLLPLLGFSLKDVASAWKEESAAEDVVDFDVNPFSSEDPSSFARAVVDGGHASKIRVPLGSAVFRQVKEADEAIGIQSYNESSNQGGRDVS